MIDAGTIYKRVIQIVQLLAAPADRQVGAFPLFVVVADELALTFHEVLLLARQEAHLSADIQALLPLAQDIDDVLSCMSERHDPSLWTAEALHKSSAWQTVRERAGLMLDSLHASRELSDLSWIRYVPGQPNTGNS